MKAPLNPWLALLSLALVANAAPTPDQTAVGNDLLWHFDAGECWRDVNHVDHSLYRVKSSAQGMEITFGPSPRDAHFILLASRPDLSPAEAVGNPARIITDIELTEGEAGSASLALGLVDTSRDILTSPAQPLTPGHNQVVWDAQNVTSHRHAGEPANVRYPVRLDNFRLVIKATTGQTKVVLHSATREARHRLVYHTGIRTARPRHVWKPGETASLSLHLTNLAATPFETPFLLTLTDDQEHEIRHWTVPASIPAHGSGEVSAAVDTKDLKQGVYLLRWHHDEIDAHAMLAIADDTPIPKAKDGEFLYGVDIGGRLRRPHPLRPLRQRHPAHLEQRGHGPSAGRPRSRLSLRHSPAPARGAESHASRAGSPRPPACGARHLRHSHRHGPQPSPHPPEATVAVKPAGATPTADAEMPVQATGGGQTTITIPLQISASPPSGETAFAVVDLKSGSQLLDHETVRLEFLPPLPPGDEQTAWATQPPDASLGSVDNLFKAAPDQSHWYHGRSDLSGRFWFRALPNGALLVEAAILDDLDQPGDRLHLHLASGDGWRKRLEFTSSQPEVTKRRDDATHTTWYQVVVSRPLLGLKAREPLAINITVDDDDWGVLKQRSSITADADPGTWYQTWFAG